MLRIIVLAAALTSAASREALAPFPAPAPAPEYEYGNMTSQNGSALKKSFLHSFLVHIVAECMTTELKNLPKVFENLRLNIFSDVNPLTGQSGKPCAFPFIYDGVTYTKCKIIFGDIPICSTRVDSDNNHVDGHWGICNDQCPTEGMLLLDGIFSYTESLRHFPCHFCLFLNKSH